MIAVVAEIDSADPEAKAEVGRQIRRAITQQMSLTVSFVEVLSERWIIKTSSGKTSRTANRRRWLAAKQTDRGAPLVGLPADRSKTAGSTKTAS